MKNKTIPTEPIKKASNVVFHMDKIEATLAKKPYIVSASKSGTHSKLEKAQKREDKKIKRELKEYTKY